MKKKINLHDYYKACGLLYLMHEKSREAESLTSALAKLLGVQDEGSHYYGHVSDALFDTDVGIDYLLEKLKIRRPT